MSIPHEIGELIDRFDRNVDEYRFGQYNETQLRRDFLDPFFEALLLLVDSGRKVGI